MADVEWSVGELEEVAPRVWRAVCQPASVNVYVVAGDEGALVVDTGCCEEQGREIRRRAEEVAGVPLTHALVTHGHWDHWYGLAAFADLHTIGHESLAEEAARAPQPDAPRTVEPVVPTELVSIVTVVQLGNRFLEVVHPHDAHTPGDLFVTVGDARLLLAGDLVEDGTPPSVGEESDLDGWVRSLDMMLGTMRRDAVIWPGHGGPLTGDQANHQRQILSGILTQTRELAEKGIGPDTALAAATWPWPGHEALMQSAIDAGYRHWARKAIVPRPQLGLRGLS